ncbi:MAG: hypothetical protein KG012_02605 [Deltaproteobacteria bacterium]|nr:hypothetical protein [Deltaproteobacteria bacterium]
MKKARRREGASDKKDSQKQEGCSFGWEKLIEMKDHQIQFFAGDGFKRLRILDIDGKTKNIHMICELGRKTWPLNFCKLEELHQLIHNGKIELLAYEIDRLMPTWGNFITGLFKYLGCKKT